MIWRTAALAAALLFPAVALTAAPAAAQTCQPPSAEHAFEELLDVADDESPLEDEAWRIAGDQEARGQFDSPETVRMIDDLAVANGLRYDCASRMYLPVSGPDPRIAIENGEEPAETSGGGGDPAAPGPGGTTGQGSQPGAAGGEPHAGEGAPDGDLPGAGGVVEAADAAGSTGSRAGSGSGGRPTDAAEEGAVVDDGVPRPEGAPDGQGGAIALSDDEEPAGNGWAAVIAVIAIVAVVVMLAGARASRRRRSRELA